MRFLFAFLFAAYMLYFPIVFRHITLGFRLGKLAIDLPRDASLETPEPTEEIRASLAQPFRYLSHGGQSFVFESADGQYILKLFRSATIPHPWRNALRRQLKGYPRKMTPQQKAHRLFTACKIAYTQASDLTGLLYAHLNAGPGMLPEIELTDTIGRVHRLDLNRCNFAFQAKGQPIRNVFLQAVQENDREKFERLAENYAFLLKERTARLIRNTDTKVGPNFGFLGERAIEWDFGNYIIDRGLIQADARRREIHEFVDHLDSYLRKIAPDWPIDWGG